MRQRLELSLLAVVAAGLVWSGIDPYDGPTWVLEVLPVPLAVAAIATTRRRFPLSDLLLVAVALHCLVLMVGGHWTYARVPVGDWVQDALHLARNPYDRLGHFMQGFVPSLVAREILLRLQVLRRRAFLPFLVLSICLAISAAYEFVEWGAALALGGGATDFLGTQGDPWDTQWDMFMALVGASCALVLLGRAHDRAIRRIAGPMGENPETA